jgi:hypothetical protein
MEEKRQVFLYGDPSGRAEATRHGALGKPNAFTQRDQSRKPGHSLPLSILWSVESPLPACSAIFLQINLELIVQHEKFDDYHERRY